MASAGELREAGRRGESERLSDTFERLETRTFRAAGFGKTGKINRFLRKIFLQLFSSPQDSSEIRQLPH